MCDIKQVAKGVIMLGENLYKMLVFVIDEQGRTLTKESLHRLISELLDKAMGGRCVDVTVINSSAINSCACLADQIVLRDLAEWEIIYLHGSKYPPVLLNQEDKENLIVLLHSFNGTSAEAIYKVLTDSGALDKSL